MLIRWNMNWYLNSVSEHILYVICVAASLYTSKWEKLRGKSLDRRWKKCVISVCKNIMFERAHLNVVFYKKKNNLKL